MLPLLTGVVSKALLPSEKKIDKDKLFDKKNNSSVKQGDNDNGDIKENSSSQITIRKKTISTNLLLPSPEIKEPPKPEQIKNGKKLTDIFGGIGETLSGIVDFLKNKNKNKKEENKNEKKKAKLDEKKDRENKLEKKKKIKKSLNVNLPGDKFNIGRFFENILLGSIVLAIFKNLQEIISFFTDVYQTIKNFIEQIGEFFAPVWNGLVWITNEGAKLVAKLLGVPPENLDDSKLKKNLDEIIKKIPFLENLFRGITNTIESIRNGGATQTSGNGISNYGGNFGNVDVPQTEQEMLLRLIIAEASGEGELGMAAVARSVLNRAGLVQSGKVSPGRFNATGKSITDIITARNQYQPYRQGKLNKPISDSQRKMALKALSLAQNTGVFERRLIESGLSPNQAKVIIASTGFRNYAAGAGIDTSQQVNEVTFKRHTFNTAGNTGLLRAEASVGTTPSSQVQSLPSTPTTPLIPSSNNTSASEPQNLVEINRPPNQNQGTVITSTLTQNQIQIPAQTQTSTSISRISQSAEYEVPQGMSGSKVIPIPISEKSSSTVVAGGKGVMVPISISKKELLNSYYQSQLVGFLYKQG